MASEVPNANVNGDGSKSLAAMLEEQHTRDNAHKATVEDAVDEEDAKHTTPSSSVKDKQPVASTAAPSPAEPAAPSPPAQAAPKKAPALDVRSEELFPALGSGPKPQAPAPATWGAKKPSLAAAVANGVPSGTQPCMSVSYT
jgi:hypothetical protein